MPIKKNSKSNSDSVITAGSKAASMAGYVLIGKISTFLMIGIALILVTRLLGPNQYGIYTLAVSFASIFVPIGYFGIGTTLNKFISEYGQVKNSDEISILFSNAMFLVLISGIVLTLICFSLSDFVSGYVFHTSSMSYVIEIVSFWIITAMLFGSIYDSLLGFGNGKNVAIVAGIQAFFQAGISIVLAFMGFGALAPIYGLVFGYFLGFVVGIVIVFRENSLHLCMPSTKQLRALLGFSLPVAAANVFNGAVASFGLLFLGYFVLPSIVGNIGIASRTGSLMNIVFDSISFAILSTFSAAMVNKKLQNQMGRIYGYTVYVAILVVSPLLFYMAIFSMPFSYTLFGGNYSSAPLYISLLSMGLLLGIVGSYANTLMISMGKTTLALKYNSLAYIATILLFLVFVPMFGGVGYAVISFIVLPLLVDFIFIIKLRKFLKIDLRARKLLGILAANVIISAVAMSLYLLFGGIPLLVVAGIGFVIFYPILVVATGGADAGDINTIKALSRSIPLVGRVVASFADYAGVMIQ